MEDWGVHGEPPQESEWPARDAVPAQIFPKPAPNPFREWLKAGILEDGTVTVSESQRPKAARSRVTAGHTWGLNGFCSCGKRLSDVSFAAYEPHWIGKPEIAHTTHLTAMEQAEIREEVERVYDLAMDGARV